MKKRTTKRALVMSFLAMLMCCAMLIGTTYAWFTDTVTSGTNRIVAGNLDIELNVKGDDGYEKVDTDTKLFDVELWEPGVVAYETFEAANVGTLALKYNLYLNVSGMNSLNDKTLAEVIKVAIVAGELGDDTTRTGLIGAVKDELKPINLATALTAENHLLPGDSDKFTVVLYWEPTDHDNDYNANNGQKTSDEQALYIDFSIVLTATQDTVEPDSFGTDYDADAKLGGIPAVTEAINKGAADSNAALDDVTGGIVYFDDDLVYEADGVISIVLHFDTPDSKDYIIAAFDAISDLIVTAVDEEASNIYSIEIGAGLDELGLTTNVRVLNGKPVEYDAEGDEEQKSWLYEDLSNLLKQVVAPGTSWSATLQACLEYTAEEGLDVEIVAMDGSKQTYRMYFDLNWKTPVENVTDAINQGAADANAAIESAIGEPGIIWFDDELEQAGDELAITLHFGEGSFNYINETYTAVKALIGEAVYAQKDIVVSFQIEDVDPRIVAEANSAEEIEDWVEADLKTVMSKVPGGLGGALQAAQDYGLAVTIVTVDGEQVYRMNFDISPDWAN